MQNPESLLLLELGRTEEKGYTAAYLLIIFSAIFLATASVASQPLIKTTIMGVLAGLMTKELGGMLDAIVKTFIVTSEDRKMGAILDLVNLLFGVFWLVLEALRVYYPFILATVGTDMAITTLIPQVKAALLIGIGAIAVQNLLPNKDIDDSDDYYLTSATKPLSKKMGLFNFKML